jgi:hypothetical protein
MPQRLEKRVLFVSDLSAPAEGAGRERVARFVKYLPEHGWNCSVVAPGRTWRWTRAAAALLQPDPLVLWRPFAIRTGLRLLRESPHDAIVATAPPPSTLLVGATLSRRTGLPLILDCSDQWKIDDEHPTDPAVHHQHTRERSAILHARALLTATPSAALQLAQLVEQCGRDAQVSWIYNGFDSSDSSAPIPSTTSRTDYGHGDRLYRISCVGTLGDGSPIGPFVTGVQRLARQFPELASRLELIVAGHRTSAQERVLDGLPCRLVRLPCAAHDDAVRIMSESDALLLLNADGPDAKRVVHEMTFAYVAARRPIFTVAPEGDMWDIVRHLPGTVLCQPCATGAIADALACNIENHEAGFREEPGNWDISQFDAQHLAGELAVLLDECRDARMPAPHGPRHHERELPSHVGCRPTSATRTKRDDCQIVGL